MARHPSSTIHFRPSLHLILLTVLLFVLWIAGGGSRDDLPGQVIVRSVAAGVLIVAILFGDRPSRKGWGAVGWLLAAALILALLQLVPLPPDWWQALPGRATFTAAAVVSGQPQPWRPWSIVPDATANAAESLIVPIAALVLLSGLRDTDKRWLPAMLLTFVASATLLGLAQFSGAGIDQPFVNDTVGQASSIFANRNHFALLLAIGCVVAPVWAFANGRRAVWRPLVALGCVVLFTLMILAIGSRAGILLGGLGLIGGMMLVRQDIVRLFRGAPRWLLPTAAAVVLGSLVLLGWISFAANRAVSIQRVIAVDARTDIRGRALDTVLEMVRLYFPAGTGLGSFDPLFRLHEPEALLKPTFFNHAHNDYLEIALTAGLPGMLLLVAGLAWWVWASLAVWRHGAHRQRQIALLGSAILGLVAIASLFDYPARTPVVMAVMVLAGFWLQDRGKATSALPDTDQHL